MMSTPAIRAVFLENSPVEIVPKARRKWFTFDESICALPVGSRFARKNRLLTTPRAHWSKQTTLSGKAHCET